MHVRFFPGTSNWKSSSYGSFPETILVSLISSYPFKCISSKVPATAAQAVLPASRVCCKSSGISEGRWPAWKGKNHNILQLWIRNGQKFSPRKSEAFKNANKNAEIIHIYIYSKGSQIWCQKLWKSGLWFNRHYFLGNSALPPTIFCPPLNHSEMTKTPAPHKHQCPAHMQGHWVLVAALSFPIATARAVMDVSNEDPSRPSLYRPIPSEPGFEHELVLSCYFDIVWQVEIKTSTWRQQSQHWKNRIVAWFTRQVRNVVRWSSFAIPNAWDWYRTFHSRSLEHFGTKRHSNKLTNKPQTGRASNTDCPSDRGSEVASPKAPKAVV